MGRCKALRRAMQSFALDIVKLCVDWGLVWNYHLANTYIGSHHFNIQ